MQATNCNGQANHAQDIHALFSPFQYPLVDGRSKHEIEIEISLMGRLGIIGIDVVLSCISNR